MQISENQVIHGLIITFNNIPLMYLTILGEPLLLQALPRFRKSGNSPLENQYF